MLRDDDIPQLSEITGGAGGCWPSLKMMAKPKDEQCFKGTQTQVLTSCVSKALKLKFTQAQAGIRSDTAVTTCNFADNMKLELERSLWQA